VNKKGSEITSMQKRIKKDTGFSFESTREHQSVTFGWLAFWLTLIELILVLLK